MFALHGSSKTEETEIIVLKHFVNIHNLKNYLPETDYSTAKYFQNYIETVDEKLLKELVQEYGVMVPQEISLLNSGFAQSHYQSTKMVDFTDIYFGVTYHALINGLKTLRRPMWKDGSSRSRPMLILF